jgi:hypothetical protein
LKIALGVVMAEPTVCLNRKFLIKNASADKVISESHKALVNIGLKLKKESSLDGKTSMFAAEGALVPITLKVITYVWNLSEYMKSAQRAGIHVLVVPSSEGVYMYVCGFSIGNITGRPEKYPEVSVEEVTDTLNALNFEEKFVNAMTSAFPELEEVSQPKEE